MQPRSGFARLMPLAVTSLAVAVGGSLPSWTRGSGISVGLPDHRSVLLMYCVGPMGWVHDYRIAPAAGIHHQQLGSMLDPLWDVYSLRLWDAVYQVTRPQSRW